VPSLYGDLGGMIHSGKDQSRAQERTRAEHGKAQQITRAQLTTQLTTTCPRGFEPRQHLSQSCGLEPKGVPEAASFEPAWPGACVCSFARHVFSLYVDALHAQVPPYHCCNHCNHSLLSNKYFNNGRVETMKTGTMWRSAMVALL